MSGKIAKFPKNWTMRTLCVDICWCALFCSVSSLVLTFGYHHRNKGLTNLSRCHEAARAGLCWMTHHWFRSVRGPSTVNQQDETIAMITEALPSGATQREHHTYPNSPSQCAKEAVSRPINIQRHSHEAVETHRNVKWLFLNIQAHPIECEDFYWASSEP